MHYPAPHRLITLIPLLVAGLIAPYIAQAQVHIGAHTMLKVGQGDGVSPAVTPPIATQHRGSSMIVFNGGDTRNLATPTDTYSNTWTPLGDPVVYNGYPGSSVMGYVSLAATGGPNHVISIAKHAYPADEITVPFVEIENAGILQDFAQNYPASGTTITSGSVTTTGPATLVALWWGDAGVKVMTAVPGNGFSIIESFLHLPDNSGVQCAVAVKQVTGPGTYSVTWTDNPSQGAILWLLAFQSRGGGTLSDPIFANGFD